jgi:hypothetical protein
MKRNAPPVAPGHKYCFRCATGKPVAEFYAVPSRPDGRDARCKVCAREASKESYAIRRCLQALYQSCQARQGGAQIDLHALELER